VSTVADALTAAGAKVEYDAVCSATGAAVCNASAIAAAKVTAQAADVAIFVLGDGHGECGEWGDRDSLDLAGGQLLMLQQLAGVAPHTIVVLLHGRPQTFGVNNVALEQVDALFAAWRPGEEGAAAIVDLITGAANPSGKLVQSWPRSVGQVLGGSSPFLQRVRGKWVANSRTCTADGRCYDGYVNADSTPLFFFGSGLSYTTFEYGALAVTPLMPTASAEQLRITDWQMAATDLPIVNVTVMVHNTGTTAGTEVVQVYVKDPSGLPFVP
jgi:beta-glucosidase